MMKPFASLAVAALTAGCVAHATPTASAPITPHGLDQDARGTACVAAGTWYDPAQETIVSPAALMDRLRNRDVVLLGETHVIADHHRWQMQMVAQLYAQRPDMILGFEAFPRRVQDTLDRWVAGELSEAEFLKQSDWETVWKYDAQFYLPMFHFARLNKIPMVALNVDRALIREVSEKGWTNVPTAHRRGVGDPAPATAGYLDMLGAVYGRHDNAEGDKNGAPKAPGLDDPMFSNFVDVQLTWDRAMAEAAATALNAARTGGRDPRLIAIVGRGHMDHFYGIPEQLKALGETNFAVLTPWDQLRQCADLVKPDGTAAADAVFGLAETKDTFAPEKPKLGVFIESTDDGVRVGDVVEGSIAEAAGLKKGDLIVRAAGTPITRSGQLVTIIKSISPGTWLPLNVKRNGEDMEIVARFPAAKPQDKVHGK